MTQNTLQLAVFVSGRGSNLEAIERAIEEGRLNARIALILSSKSDAPALEYGRTHAIPAFFIPPRSLGEQERCSFILGALQQNGVSFIALAGYLHLLEAEVISSFRNRIVNIHPALLPAFGGKGMYGHFVHEAVLASGAKVSGASVHIVDEAFDRGPIVAQRVVPVIEGDTAASLAARVLKAEHSLYPEALQLFAESRVHVEGHKTHISGIPPALNLYEESTDQRF